MRLVKRLAAWLEDRTGVWALLKPQLTHLVPANARWWYVLGSAVLACFLFQIATGVALALYYVPGSASAYQTLQYLTNDSAFGSVLRAMHFYGASAMIGLVVLHMTQVYLHAAYKYPREINWISGVCLLLFTVVMGFTGQILRWDGNALWSMMVGTDQFARIPYIGRFLAWMVLGGSHPGAATLSRMFVFHVFIMPGMILAFVALHLWLVLRNGISEMPDPKAPVKPKTYRENYRKRIKKYGVPFWPDTAWRDAVFSSVVILAVIAAALIFGPPGLDIPPNPVNYHIIPGPDWYLRWYFAVLALSPATIETYIIIGAPLLAVGALFLLPLVFKSGHRAPTKRPWALGFILVGAVLFSVLTILGYTEPWSPRFKAGPLPQSVTATSDPQVARGAKLFQSHGCIFCHLVKGAGGYRGPELTAVASRLTPQQMTVRINNGGNNMPAFADSLNTGQVEALVAFLQTLKASQVQESK